MPFNVSAHFVRRKEWFICACGLLRYELFLAASIKFIDYSLA
jgi:hypothetical protein